MRAVAVATLVVATCACRETSAPPIERLERAATASAAAQGVDSEPSAPPTASASSRPSTPPPLSGEPFLSLPVSGYRDAVVSLPLGATEPRRLVVALHGNYDRPEWQCEVWRGVTGGGDFILCPRGVPRDDAPPPAERFTYTTSKATFLELEAAKAALVERYARHLADGPPVLVGFSLGAIYAAREIVERPSAFPYVALVEGGYDGWTASRVRRYVEGGGKRVLFACAQTVCRNGGKSTVPLFEKYGGEARVEYAPGAGHTYDGKVAELVAAQWAWLTGAPGSSPARDPAGPTRP